MYVLAGYECALNVEAAGEPNNIELSAKRLNNKQQNRAKRKEDCV